MRKRVLWIRLFFLLERDETNGKAGRAEFQNHWQESPWRQAA